MSSRKGSPTKSGESAQPLSPISETNEHRPLGHRRNTALLGPNDPRAPPTSKSAKSSGGEGPSTASEGSGARESKSNTATDSSQPYGVDFFRLNFSPPGSHNWALKKYSTQKKSQ